MEIQLERSDIAQVASISSRNTLALLPVGKKNKQKMVIGDDSGTLSCFEIKRGEPQSVFRLTGDNGPVVCVTMGGAAAKKDKVFASYGTKLSGITKKGKEFFKLTSALTESINYIFVEDTRIWTGCEYIYNLYEDGQDVGFYMSHDRINCLYVDNVISEAEMNPILGCQDRCLRILKNSQLAYDVAVDGPVNALCPYNSSGSQPGVGSPREFVYGTTSASFGQLYLDTNGAEAGWTSRNQNTAEMMGAFNCLYSTDLTGDGMKEIIAGTDHGQVHVYTMSPRMEPVISFNRSLSESVRDVSVGVVSNPGNQEILCTSLGGKVTSFTTYNLRQRDDQDAYGRSVATVQNENKIRSLRREIDTLRVKVEQKKEKFKQYSEEYFPQTQQFKINAHFALDPEEAAYKMSLEIPMPIDIVCLQSTVRLDFLDVASNPAIVSMSPPDLEHGNQVLATYRCQDALKRVEIKARTIEGEHGSVQAAVVAQMNPKTGQVVKFDIKPLSLHHRVHVLDDEELNRPKNTLKLSGQFTVATVHEWVVQCLPGVPPRSQDEEITMYFRNVFTKSVLITEYRKESAVFKSDSVSAIAILKEVISREATARRIQIRDTFQYEPQSIAGFLKLLHPHLQRQLQLARQVELIDAIKEIHMQEDDNQWMFEEYCEILKNADAIRAEFKDRPRALEFLSGIITDLFVDQHKFRGHDVKHKIPDLHAILRNYKYEDLLDFFNQRHT
mmetsp:Transcript_26862/g.33595  ORF Transcript_26862/g.33595 Transcript_26862/m.33595 type:complete len:726 (-) Transcript_26862:330-2507(-)